MTFEEYIAGVEWLKMHLPGHPLLPSLQAGHSRINILYLKQALKAVPQEASNDIVPEAADADLKTLLKNKKSLFARRAKLSNSFHDCDTDADRAGVSDEIQIVQRQIETVNKQIRHYEATGELLPEGKNVVDATLPGNGVQLVKKLNSLRANISIKKSKLEQLVALPEEHPDKKKIAGIEDRLRKLEIEKANVERAIAEASI